MYETKLSKIAPISVLFISIFSILPYLNFYLNVAIFEYLFDILILLIFLVLPYYATKNQNMILLKLLLIYYLFCALRGIMIAENYLDYKQLVGNSSGLLLAIVALTSINSGFTRDIFVYYLKYTLPLFIVFFFIISDGAVGFYLVPISIMTLFFPLFKSKYKFLLFSFSLFVIIYGTSNRSNIIKFTVPFFLLSFYYIKILKTRMLMNIVRNLFFILPIVFFILAVSGSFNVFRMDEYIKIDFSEIEATSNKNGTDDFKADTRTGLYVEVLQTAKKYNSWLIGRTPARGNETLLFKEIMIKQTGRAERIANEVAILNIFTWTGILGLLLHSLVFYQASFLAINRSNNVFSKILGVYVSFRWLFGWIEDVNFFNLTTFMLWIIIGICYSDKFRSMSEMEIKLWIQGIKYKVLRDQVRVQ